MRCSNWKYGFLFCMMSPPLSLMGQAPGNPFRQLAPEMAPMEAGARLSDFPTTQPATVKLVVLKYVAPGQLALLLRNVYGTNEWRFVPDDRTKALIITGPGEMPASMKQVIDQGDKPGEETAVRAFKLHEMDASSTCNALLSAVKAGPFNCSPVSAESILVSAAPSTFNSIETALQQLRDAYSQLREERGPVKIVAIPQNIPDSLLPELLKLVGAQGSAFALDTERHAIITSAPPQVVEQLASVLDSLATQTTTTKPVANASADTAAFRIRLVWLSTKGSEAPADLIPAVEELSKIGISVPYAVMQAVIQTNTGNASIVAHSAEGDLTLKSQRRSPRNLYEMQLTAFTTGGNLPPQEIVNVRTELQIPMNHPIVLAVTPTGKEQSAFVLEFLPGEKEAVPRKKP